MPTDSPRRLLARVARRIVKILADTRKLNRLKNRQRLASYAELGITGLMPSAGLCRVAKEESVPELLARGADPPQFDFLGIILRVSPCDQPGRREKT